MTTRQTGSLADLHGAIRIAKAASFGITGNAPRVERAERALETLTRLVDHAVLIANAIEFRIDDPRAALLDDLKASITAAKGAA